MGKGEASEAKSKASNRLKERSKKITQASVHLKNVANTARKGLRWSTRESARSEKECVTDMPDAAVNLKGTSRKVVALGKEKRS